MIEASVHPLLLTLVLLLGVALNAKRVAAEDAQSVSDKIAEAQLALRDWQLNKAKALAQELHERLPDVPPVQALVGAVNSTRASTKRPFGCFAGSRRRYGAANFAVGPKHINGNQRVRGKSAASIL